MALLRCRSIVRCNPSQLLQPPRSFAFSCFFNSSTPEIGPKLTVPTADHLLNKHRFSPETAFKVSSVVAHLNDPENADSVISFLTDSGFSKTQVEHVVKTLPKIICTKPESTLEPKIKIFRDFNFSPTDTANILSAGPWILINYSADQIEESCLLLRKILGSDFRRVIIKDGHWLLRQYLGQSLLPNIESLKSCGISSSQLVMVFRHFPRILSLKPDTFRKSVQKADEMGVSRESKMFVYAVRTLISMSAENWESKLHLFRSVGFTDDDIVSVFRRLPNVFAVSERKIKGIAELLLGSGIYDISFIVNYPQIFIYSIERTIKPRLQVLKILKAKNLLVLKANTYVYLLSDEKFIERYVVPFLNEASELSGLVSETKYHLKTMEEINEASF